MSYKVSFDLEMQGRNQPSIEEVAGQLVTLVDKFDPHSDLDRELYNGRVQSWVSYLENGGRIRWYSYKDDMLQVSRRWPDTMFILTGIGEENGDYRRAYFQNGSSHEDKGKLVFPEFHPGLLKREEPKQGATLRQRARRSRTGSVRR